ncbi:MAG: hypothetical protein Q9204_005081, partial [Flavoplaca sp. TL-2023a]
MRIVFLSSLPLILATSTAALKSQTFIATLDTLPKVEDTGATAAVPTPYVGLAWSNWIVASEGNSILRPAHSDDAGALGQLLDGSISTIAVQYPGSKT